MMPMGLLFGGRALDASRPCEHEWLTVCDGKRHVDECSLCGLVVESNCPDAGTWMDYDEEDE